MKSGAPKENCSADYSVISILFSTVDLSGCVLHRLTLKSSFILSNPGTAIGKHGDPGATTANLASLQRRPGKQSGTTIRRYPVRVTGLAGKIKCEDGEL